MAKGKKQSANDLLERYSRESVSLDAASSRAPVPVRKGNPLLEGLRRNVNRVVMIPIDILVIEENVRHDVDEKSPEFLGLVDSIRESGVRQNIIVDLQDEDEETFKLVVVAGQRRTLAGKRAGIKQVAALILRMKGRGERLVEGLAENLLREDLHCLDQAEAYAALVEEGWSQEHIAEKFERRRRTILKFLRLARLPQRAKDLIRANREVFTTHLLLNKFIARNWKSESELMQALKEVLNGSKPKPKTQVTTNAKLEGLTKSVNRYNGLTCKISGDDDTGRITITYKNKTALEKIISLFEND
jgi:ParB/RepB/Spo0J family partition protein